MDDFLKLFFRDLQCQHLGSHPPCLLELCEDDPLEIVPSFGDDAEVCDRSACQGFSILPDVIIRQNLFDVDPSSFIA